MSLINAEDLGNWLGFPTLATSQEDAIDACIAAVENAVRDWWGHDLVAAADDVITTRIFGAYGCSVRTDDFVGTPTVSESADRATWSTVTDTFWTTPENAVTQWRINTDRTLGRWVQVTATFGLGEDLVEAARHALLLKAARLWSRKKSPTMVEGTSDWGIVRVTSREDPDVVDLLGHTRRMDKLAGIA